MSFAFLEIQIYSQNLYWWSFQSERLFMDTVFSYFVAQILCQCQSSFCRRSMF